MKKSNLNMKLILKTKRSLKVTSSFYTDTVSLDPVNSVFSKAS